MTVCYISNISLLWWFETYIWPLRFLTSREIWESIKVLAFHFSSLCLCVIYHLLILSEIKNWYSTLGLGDTIMDSSFKKNACNRKLKFDKFHSVGLLARLFIFNLIAQRLHLILRINYIPNYLSLDKYWNLFNL